MPKATRVPPYVGVDRALKWMQQWTQSERERFFEALTECYCPSCGRAQPEDGDLCECVAEAGRTG